MSKTTRSLLCASAASVVVLLAGFWWLHVYHPAHATWIVLPSGVRCPPPILPTSVDWAVAAAWSVQTFAIVFVLAVLVAHRRGKR